MTEPDWIEMSGVELAEKFYALHVHHNEQHHIADDKAAKDHHAKVAAYFKKAVKQLDHNMIYRVDPTWKQ